MVPLVIHVNGTIGSPNVTIGTVGKPMIPLATNGTISKISNGTIGRTPNSPILKWGSSVPKLHGRASMM